MQYRTLGRTGLRVSVLGFGALRLPFDDAEASVEIIRHALDQGINLVDTRPPRKPHPSGNLGGFELK